MYKNFVKILVALVFVIGSFVVIPRLSQKAFAACTGGVADTKGCLDAGACLNTNGTTTPEGVATGCPAQSTAQTTVNHLVTTIINIFSTLVGIVAVVMIIWAGFKYITSGGDSGNISTAKTTITYAIVGLIIVAMAQIIVRFVLAEAK